MQDKLFTMKEASEMSRILNPIQPYTEMQSVVY